MEFRPRHIATVRFVGARYDDHGVPVSIIHNLLKYQEAVRETAKELWREANPQTRVPRRLVSGFVAKFRKIKRGSVAIPLYREVPVEPDSLPFEPPSDEIDAAARIIDVSVIAAANREAPPSALPASAFSFIEDLGNQLCEDESMWIKAGSSDVPAVFHKRDADVVREWSARGIEERALVAGYVCSIDFDKKQFAIRDRSTDRKIPSQYQPEFESAIIGALANRVRTTLYIQGTGLFAPDNMMLRKIVHIDSIQAREEKPLWMRIVELGRQVPDAEWASVPTDLSRNLDHYLYGAPKEEECDNSSTMPDISSPS